LVFVDLISKCAIRQQPVAELAVLRTELDNGVHLSIQLHFDMIEAVQSAAEFSRRKPVTKLLKPLNKCKSGGEVEDKEE
jgi:hypothetical protein